ncbi:MAG: hypothetical protein HeimC2_09840 [Candidatus Heimdallarchaeota archaeon LC_2]|nr:MAG: hypothetical protein HeimC2_09840 [Candidatus Heimdallarchaeota archaeon LC_2]
MFEIPDEKILIDSLVNSIQKAISYLGINYPSWFISGVTGLGARFSLSMNVKTGKEIGHPSSNFIWDIISTAENCFSDLGIDWKLYLGQLHSTNARNTSAQSSRKLSSRVVLIDNIDDIELNGPLIIANPNGEWEYYVENLDDTDIDENKLPFGYVILQINSVDENIDIYHFPKSTLQYLIHTLERGEEPMEIIGIGNYSAVSGWKAFARWMQALSLPIEEIKHPNLEKIIQLLHIRRSENSIYWDNLSKNLINIKEKDFAIALSEIYTRVASKFIDNDTHKYYSFTQSKEIYFLEQETLPIYKNINSYLKNL